MVAGMATAMQWGTARMNLCQRQEQVLAYDVLFHDTWLVATCNLTGDKCMLSRNMQLLVCTLHAVHV